MNTTDINNKIAAIVDYVNCCKLNKKHKYKYVKYEDDINNRNNIMFDLKGIEFSPEIQWTNCELYESE